MKSWNQHVIRYVEPKEGWLPLLLLAGAVFCVIAAVLEANWVPEDGVVVWATLGGVLLGVVLAKRPLSTPAGWLFIFLYGILIVLVNIANLWPSWTLLFQGWQPLRQHWLQNGALFLDQAGSWFTAVFNGQSSQETIIFALGLGLLTYFLAAFASWQLFRHYRPLGSLLALGLALALNGYFGGVQIWWIGFFVGIAALLTALMHIISLEQTWDDNQVDYSEEVRIDLFVHAAVIATILLSVALTLPSISIRQLVSSFQEQPAVQQAEAILERAFAGVESAGRGQPGGPDGVGGSGILPREFLLGNAPELYETVVMTAVVQSEANLTGVHWRALNYDVYTGAGWALSEERQETVSADTAIQLPPLTASGTVSQTVYWVQDSRLARYSLGLPQQFDQEVEAIWRGQTDLVRVQGTGSSYTVQSQPPQATAEMLRATAVTDVPPAILARYTALPDGIPQRVLDLAQEVAGNQGNPYDQAQALEQFLRQYPYSLDVESPPRNADPVDHFLFEQQTGYCDFYASSMVVMARAMGLPARLGIGYLAQPTDPDGVQVVYQINSHSWAEVYFADFGWVEFEPTAAFTSPHSDRTGSPAAPTDFEDQPPEFNETVPPPLPEIDVVRPFPWWQLFILSLFAAVVWWLWRRGQLPAGQDAVVWSYGRLQHSASKLGQSPAPSQTPQEFSATFQTYLQRYGRFPRLVKWINQLQPHLNQLTNLYVRRTYAGDSQSGRMAAWQSWQKMKRPLWLLRFIRQFNKNNL